VERLGPRRCVTVRVCPSKKSSTLSCSLSCEQVVQTHVAQENCARAVLGSWQNGLSQMGRAWSKNQWSGGAGWINPKLQNFTYSSSQIAIAGLMTKSLASWLPRDWDLLRPQHKTRFQEHNNITSRHSRAELESYEVADVVKNCLAFLNRRPAQQSTTRHSSTYRYCQVLYTSIRWVL